MNHSWSIIDAATGQVLRTGSTSTLADIPAPPPGAVRRDGVRLNGETTWVKDGVPTARPRLSVPKEIDTTPGQAVDLDVPPGTEVTKGNIKLGAAAGRVSFTPTEAGRTILQLTPPFPFQPTMVTIVADRAKLAQDRTDSMKARVAAARSSFRGLE